MVAARPLLADRHHRPPLPPPTIISLPLPLPLFPSFDDERFRRLLVRRVYPDYVAEYTSGRVFAASFLSSRRVHLFGRLIALVPSPRPRGGGRVDRRSRDYDTIDLEGGLIFLQKKKRKGSSRGEICGRLKITGNG